jgi:nucleotide-binding universal stress UspA family protein
VSAATTRSRTPDRLCAEAVDLARAAAEEAAAPGVVGEHVELVSEGDRVVTHFFECMELGYRGWRWAVTVARASRAKIVTVDEAVLLPGPDALLAPEWVPWSERLRPGDMGPGDLLPTDAEDLRLEPGWTGEDEPVAGSAVSEELAELVEAEDAEVTAGPPAHLVPPSRGSIAAIADELGMGRARVLSRYGLHTAADRWEEAFGPKTPMAQAAPAACVSCGFLVRIGGSLGQAFGVCANEFSPADGRVVSLAYGCGGHSEAAVMPRPPQPAPPVIDETRVDPFPLRPAADSGSVLVTEDESTAELGHS